MGTLIVGGLLLAAIIGAVIYLRRSHGECACSGGGCSCSCSSADGCHSATTHIE